MTYERYLRMLHGVPSRNIAVGKVGVVGWEESSRGTEDDRGLAEQNPVSAVFTDHFYTSDTSFDLMN